MRTAGPLQPVHGRVQEVQDLPLQGAPAGLALLPGVQLQEGHLRHVRQEDDERQELQAKQPIRSEVINRQDAGGDFKGPFEV